MSLLIYTSASRLKDGGDLVLSYEKFRTTNSYINAETHINHTGSELLNIQEEFWSVPLSITASDQTHLQDVWCESLEVVPHRLSGVQVWSLTGPLQKMD